MSCDITVPYEFPSLESCQKRFSQARKEVELAPHTVVGLVLQVRDAGEFPQALGLVSLDPFSQSGSRVDVSQPWRRRGITGDLYSLNLLARLLVFTSVLLCKIR